MMGRQQRMAQARAMLSAQGQMQPMERINVEFEEEEEETNSPSFEPPIPTIPVQRDSRWANVGRNDPCPCGSGKKFKKCHGASQI
jgi:preprotein translocase subunit SecA